jgi:hypothetical protein
MESVRYDLNESTDQKTKRLSAEMLFTDAVVKKDKNSKGEGIIQKLLTADEAWERAKPGDGKKLEVNDSKDSMAAGMNYVEVYETLRVAKQSEGQSAYDSSNRHASTLHPRLDLRARTNLIEQKVIESESFAREQPIEVVTIEPELAIEVSELPLLVRAATEAPMNSKVLELSQPPQKSEQLAETSAADQSGKKIVAKKQSSPEKVQSRLKKQLKKATSRIKSPDQIRRVEPNMEQSPGEKYAVALERTRAKLHNQTKRKMDVLNEDKQEAHRRQALGEKSASTKSEIEPHTVRAAVAETAIEQVLQIPPGHHLQRSSWHTIEVDKLGRAVENPVFAYGEEFQHEQHQETWHDNVSMATSGQAAVDYVNTGTYSDSSQQATTKMAKPVSKTTTDVKLKSFRQELTQFQLTNTDQKLLLLAMLLIIFLAVFGLVFVFVH